MSIASNIITQGCQHSVLENCNICEQFKSPTCFVEESTDELLTKFIQHLSEMQKQSYTLTKQKYFLVFQRIETRMKTLQNLLKTYVTERQERENLNLEDAEVSEADEFDSSVMEVNVTEDSPDSEFEQRINVPNTYTRFLQKLCQEDRLRLSSTVSLHPLLRKMKKAMRIVNEWDCTQQFSGLRKKKFNIYNYVQNDLSNTET